MTVEIRELPADPGHVMHTPPSIPVVPGMRTSKSFRAGKPSLRHRCDTSHASLLQPSSVTEKLQLLLNTSGVVEGRGSYSSACEDVEFCLQ